MANFHTEMRWKYLEYLKMQPGIPELIKEEIKAVVIHQLDIISKIFAAFELEELRSRQEYFEQGKLEEFVKVELPFKKVNL